MAISRLLARPPAELMDDANHDLVHSLSVRLDARWHDRDYRGETHCPGCQSIFDKLAEMDAEAVQMLSAELARHVESGKFPVDLSE